VVPGLLIYVVSYQFVSRSIETWFDVEVEGALNAGVNLARVTLETLASDMAANTRSASSQLSQVPDAGAGLVLERMRDQLGASDLVLWSAAGQPLASAGQSLLKLNPTRPSAQMLQQARQQRGAWQIEGWKMPSMRTRRCMRACVCSFPWSIRAWGCWKNHAIWRR